MPALPLGATGNVGPHVVAEPSPPLLAPRDEHLPAL